MERWREMESGVSQIRNNRFSAQRAADWAHSPASGSNPATTAYTMADRGMQPDTHATVQEALRPRPLVELLDCPAEISSLLNGSARFLAVEAGQVVFRQDAACQGLYVLVTGRYLRRAVRLGARFMLGPARAGDVVELAAALGEGSHTYTLSAQTDGSALLLPCAPLNRALESHPPLRMRLLEELAREVSRGYGASCQDHTPKSRRRGSGPPLD